MGALILAVGMIDGACHVCGPKLTYDLELFSAFDLRGRLSKCTCEIAVFMIMTP